MITKHSIDLARVSDPCFALMTKTGNCRVMKKMDENCGTYKCPFYKPKDCRDWIRVKGRDGVNLIPPEDL